MLFKYFRTLLICFSFITMLSVSSCKKDDNNDKRVRVYIGSNTFNPSAVSIPAGGSVYWENDDNITHTVTSDSLVFDSGDLAPNGTFSRQFPEAGVYNYHCAHHSSMHGMVIVQ
jgi:plastocyanin